MRRFFTLALLLAATAPAHAQPRVFDMHVHLRDGAASADAFEVGGLGVVIADIGWDIARRAD